jgi:IS30 family transposase
MVGKWASENPITLEQRKLIEQGIKSNLSYREIGELAGRAKTTVMREAKRLGDVECYNAIKAQKDFERKQKDKVALISKAQKKRWKSRKGEEI